MRAFHMTWLAFFLCFFAWFGIAPLMPVIREELALTKSQIMATMVASVAITVVARLVIGWLCDRIGPRLAYTWLLILASLPVMGIGLAHNFETFLIFRLLIGAIGASFVITQYHTSVMFAPNCVGTANATAAGWGNLGGGVTQAVMPLLFTLFAVTLGLGSYWGWRLAMVVAGALCLATGMAYYLLTQDCPAGNYRELRARGQLPPAQRARGTFLASCRDLRVWALAVAYGACFGVELTMDNVAALYFADYFDLGLTGAGFTAAAFGGMNLFARSLGGIVGDRFGLRFGLRGRVSWLFVVLLCEGLALMLFSQMQVLAWAIPALLVAGLFVKMANGATYAVVPFVNRKALGPIAGIVGAGGNVGAVLAGLLFGGNLAWPAALLVLGVLVTAASFAVLSVRFSAEAEADAARELWSRLTPNDELAPAAAAGG
jgi:NNP family nitrate/nitrite transporter-like MFS transporter